MHFICFCLYIHTEKVVFLICLFLLHSLWSRRRFFPLQPYTVYEIYGYRIKMKWWAGYWLPHRSQMSRKCAMSNMTTSLSNCSTFFWYFASRMAKITYFTILSWLLLACTQRCTFSNIYSSEQLEALWDCFFFHYTVSIFQIHFIVLPSIQNLLRQRHCWWQPPVYGWSLRIHKDTWSFQEMRKQSEEVLWCENS